MSDLVIPPRVEFEVSDRGGEYLHKLRALAAAVDASMDGYNAMITARNDAVSILGEITALVQQALTDIEAVRSSGMDELATARVAALHQLATQLDNASTQIDQARDAFATQQAGAVAQIEAGKLEALTQFAASLDAAVAQLGGMISSADATFGQVLEDVLSIYEDSLPVQAGHANKALITNGTSSGWQHTAGFNRYADSSLMLESGDRVLITATRAGIQASLPAAPAIGTPFLLRNSSTSTHEAVLLISSETRAAPGIPAWMAGDTVRILPGEQIFLVMNTTCLEVIA